jgi:hypothetical protein
MIRFKCNGQPYIDPLHRFTIEDWDPPFTKEGEPKAQTDIDRPVFIGLWNSGGFKIMPGQPINTTVFEEVIIA